MVVQVQSALLFVTHETLVDASWFGPFLGAHFEWEALELKPKPLASERLRGLQRWTASNGVTLSIRIGWRAELHDALQDFRRDAWPEPDEC